MCVLLIEHGGEPVKEKHKVSFVMASLTIPQLDLKKFTKNSSGPWALFGWILKRAAFTSGIATKNLFVDVLLLIVEVNIIAGVNIIDDFVLIILMLVV